MIGLAAGIGLSTRLIGAAPAKNAAGDVVGKITVGYQGWFACKGDGSPVNNWAHDNLEMWPDVREYNRTYSPPVEKFGTSKLGSGRPARLFSSYDDQVVQTHFRWMAQSQIDCAALQRFANEIGPDTPIKAQRDGMAQKAMRAAEANKLKFYVMYDVSGWGVRGLKEDWSETITRTLKLTQSAAYAKQNDKPVVCIYGIGYQGWPASPEEAAELIQWFKKQGCYVIGSVPGQWRNGTGDSRADFEPVYQQFNMISAWAVGRVFDQEYPKWIKGDAEYCQKHDIDYQPCVYPGTSFHNSNGSKKNLIPRQNGHFLWSQFRTLRETGVKTAYVAMFDELNEATSIFKCAETAAMAPAGKWMLTLDADGTRLSSDFYLRLTRDAGRMIKGLAPLRQKCPTPPFAPLPTTTRPATTRPPTP